MKKSIQLAAIITLLSASNGYAWEWPNWRAWFAAPKPGPNYRKLEVKGTPTTKFFDESYLEIPSDLDPNQNYEIAKIGDEYYLKTTPSKKTDREIHSKQYQSPWQVWRQQIWSKRISENKTGWRKGWSPERIHPYDIENHKKAYLRPEGDTSDGELITYIPKPKISPTEKAFNESQRLLGE